MEKDITELVQDFIDGNIDSFESILCPDELWDLINDMVWEDIQMEVGDINWWEWDWNYNYIWEKIWYCLNRSAFYSSRTKVWRIDKEWYEI